MPTEIGTSYLKTNIAKILRRVELGESFVVTRRGKPVAELFLPRLPVRRSRAEIAKAVEALRNFPRLPAIPHETVRAWIEEGRE